MRCAVLLTGEARNYDSKDIYTSLINNLIEPLNADVFIATWNKRGYSHNHGNPVFKPYRNLNVSKDDFDKIYPNIKDVLIMDEDKWLETCNEEYKQIYYNGFMWGDQFIKGTIVPQSYTLMKANELKKHYEEINHFKYDLVIRTRFDNQHYSKIHSQYLNDLSNIYAINTLPHYYPNRIFDIFFFGNSKNMDILSNTYNELLENINHPYDNGLNKYDSCRVFYVQCLRYFIKVFDLQQVVCFPEKYKDI